MTQKVETYATISREDFGFVLSVLTKQTFGWSEWGRLTEAEQQPMTHDVELAETNHFVVPITGRDTWPMKYATDVVVTGCARPRRAVRQMDMSVRVGNHESRLTVFGDRFVEHLGEGRVAFSEPELFEEMSLGWTKAYGGMDPTVLPKNLDDTPMFCGKPVVERFPGTYPRNPAGVGYFVNATDEILDINPILPNQEDPDHLLTPETLFVTDPRLWWRQPPPKSFGWFHTLWFPRCVLAGGTPYHLPPRHVRDDLVEVERGRLTTHQLDLAEGEVPVLHRRMTSEAAPDLVLPYLHGDEVVELKGFSPDGSLSFRLPGETPEVTAVVDREALVHERPRVHTLCIDAESREFYVLMCHPFVLPDRLAPDLLAPPLMDELFSRFDVRVDGRQLEREEWPTNRVDPMKL